MVGQKRARKACGILRTMIKEGKLAGRAVLLVGQPGTGKTAIAMALAQSLGDDTPFTMMAASEIYSLEMSKSEALRQAFRKSVAVRLREEAEIIEGEVVEIQIDRPASGTGAKLGKITMKTTDMETMYELGQKMIESLAKQNVTAGDVISIDRASGKVTRLGRSLARQRDFDAAGATVRYVACFAEHDHELLTERGFVRLADVLAHVECGADGTVRDWRGLRVANYCASTQQLVYEQPRRLVVNAPRADGVELVELTGGGGVSVACTPNHMLYVRHDSDAGGKFAKVSASDVLRDERPLRFLARAANGVSAKHATRNDGNEAHVESPESGDNDESSHDDCDNTRGDRVTAAARQFDGTRLPPWTLELSAAASRRLLLALPRIDDDNAAVRATTTEARDQLVRLALHAGCTASAERSDEGAWRVCIVDSDSSEHNEPRCATRAVVARYTQRTWCFDMNDGFVVVRRVLSDGGVSRATIQGNCPEGELQQRRDVTHAVALHEIDVINSRTQGFLALFAGDTGEIKAEVREQIDAKVAQWRDEGKASLKPGVLFIDEAHMLDIESFAYLNRALESELAPVLVLATNRGAAPIRGTAHVGAHGMPADLLDRLLIVATEPCSGADMRRIIEIRAREEDVTLSADALELLGKTAADTSLRYAMRLISAAALVAARRKAATVEVDDVRRVYNLFFDTGRSAEFLAEMGNKLLAF